MEIIMATIRKLNKKRGEAYQIGFTNPLTRKWIRRTFWCSKKDAMKIKKKIEADIAFGVFKMEPDNSLKITYSFKDLKNRYLKHSKQNNTYKTVDRVKSVFNVFYKYLRSNKLLSNGDIRLNDITQNIIELYNLFFTAVIIK